MRKELRKTLIALNGDGKRNGDGRNVESWKGKEGEIKKVLLFVEQKGLILTPTLLWILKRIVQ